MPDTDVQTQMVEEMRRSLGGALQQIGNDIMKLDRVSKDAVGTSGGIGRLDSAFMGMTTRLLGPVGLVAGLYQVSSALSNVAAQSVQMQSFSRNTGVASDNIKNFQLQLEMMGKTSQEAKATFGALAGTLNEFNVNQEESGLYQALIGRQGGAALVNDLQRAKNVTEQIGVMVKYYNAQPNDRQKRGLAQVFGMEPADIEAWEKNKNLVASAFNQNKEAMEEYHQASVIFNHNVSEAYKAMSGRVIYHLNELTGGAEESAETFETVIKAFNSSIDILFEGQTFGEGWWARKFNFGGLQQDIADVTAAWNGLKNLWEAAKNGDWSAGDTSGYGVDGGGVKDSPSPYPQGEDPMGADYSRKQFRSKEYWRGLGRQGADGRGGTSGSTDFSGMRRSQSIEEEQTKTLIDIRDILQRMDGGTGSGSGGAGGGGESAGSTGAGGGRGGLARALGMDSNIGGGSAGIGTRGDRNNNPGNMKFGKFAKSQGATGADDKGFAIFPTKEAGEAAHKALVQGDSYKGLTLDQFGNKYSEGSEAWKSTVGKAMGIGRNDVVDNQDPRLLDAIKRAEGTGRGGANSPGKGYMGGTGDGLPSAVIAEARKVAEREGNGESVQNYIRSQGYNVNSAWCGDFAASVVRGSGGTPPKGASIASNWRNYGTQVDSPQPGDIAVRKGVRTGSTGSHVTIVDKVGEDGRFTGLGGNQSRRRSNFGVNQFEYFRGTESPEVQAARSRMEAAKNSGTENSLKATVDFNNVPSGVKTSVESDGPIFKELQVQKSRQNEVAGGSTGQPFAGVW